MSSASTWRQRLGLEAPAETVGSALDALASLAGPAAGDRLDRRPARAARPPSARRCVGRQRPRRAVRAAVSLVVGGGSGGDRRRHRRARSAARPARRRRRRHGPRAAARPTRRAASPAPSPSSASSSPSCSPTSSTSRCCRSALDAEDVRTVVDAYFLRWHEHIEAQRRRRREVHRRRRDGRVRPAPGRGGGPPSGDPRRPEHARLARRAQRRGRLGATASRWRCASASTPARWWSSTLGDRPGQDFVVVGDIVNRAARLQSAARPGGILISADTYRHVRGSFDVQTAARPAAQGHRPTGRRLPRPRASGRAGSASTTRAASRASTPATIGRDIELRQLQDRFHEVGEERQWQMVTVVGDAGVGKSRLLADFDRWLDELPEAVWWFGGRAAHSGPRTAVRPAPRPLRHPLRHPRQ